MVVIEAENVTKEFRLGQPAGVASTIAAFLGKKSPANRSGDHSFRALKGVSFSVAKGEVLGIIGHNGAGKSTLLKLLSNISKPTTGRLTVRGKIAPLIEVGAGLVGDMTGRENIYLNGTILGIPRSEIMRKFDEIVSFAELEEFIDTPVKRYSSGMQVRLGFSIATSVSADILIVDEVLAVGDLSFQQKCIERMEALISSENRTVIIVGHNIRQLERICSRVMLLDHGRITHDGNPGDVCGAFYREAQSRNIAHHQRGDGDFVPQQSTGNIRVTAITLENEMGPCKEAVFHRPLTISVDFESDVYLTRPEVVVGLHTSDFVHVLSVSNALPDVRPDLPPGRHRVVCRLSDVPLRPFPYSLRVAFLDQYRQMLWYAENVIPVVVTPGAYQITRLPEVGLVDVAADWQFQSRT